MPDTSTVFRHVSDAGRAMVFHVESIIATARATITKNVTCEHCRSDFHYVCTYTAKGKAHVVSGIGQEEAYERAAKHAIQRAQACQNVMSSPATCPRCGRLQRDMVLLLRKKALYASQMTGWIAPAFLVGIAIGALALATNFFAETASYAWEIGTGLIGLTGVAMFGWFGVGTLLRSTTWDCNYFGGCAVTKGEGGAAEPSAAFDVLKTTRY